MARRRLLLALPAVLIASPATSATPRAASASAPSSHLGRVAAVLRRAAAWRLAPARANHGPPTDAGPTHQVRTSEPTAVLRGLRTGLGRVRPDLLALGTSTVAAGLTLATAGYYGHWIPAFVLGTSLGVVGSYLATAGIVTRAIGVAEGSGAARWHARLRQAGSATILKAGQSAAWHAGLLALAIGRPDFATGAAAVATATAALAVLYRGKTAQTAGGLATTRPTAGANARIRMGR
jgi:hypothetical protein